jgi:hypothetical protein
VESGQETDSYAEVAVTSEPTLTTTEANFANMLACKGDSMSDAQEKYLTDRERDAILREDRRQTGQEMDTGMVNELRNFHVKKLLNHLGGIDVPPYLQKAIKRSFSEFAEDITNKKDNSYGHNTDESRVGW